MKLYRVPIMIMVTISLGVGCSDRNSVSGPNGTSGRLSVPFTKVNYGYAGNTQNPYDSIGVYHNYMLQYSHAYFTAYGWPDSSSSYDAFSNITWEFADEMWVVITDTDTLAFSEALPADTLTARTIDLFNNQFPNDSTWTSWDALNGQVQQFLIDLNAVFTDSTVVDVYSTISALEEPFINNTDPDFAETRFLVLATASVARHSYAYWLDTLSRPYWPFELNDDDGGGGGGEYLTWGVNPDDQGDKRSGKKNVASDIATSDAVGAVVGTVGGAITGLGTAVVASLVTGNPLTLWFAGGMTVGGSIVGEVGGMVTASLQDAFQGGINGRAIKAVFKAKETEKRKK